MKKFASLILVAFFVISCGTSSETTIVDRSADAIQAPAGTTPPGRDIAQDVQVLRIGELNPIRSFDPPFLENHSSMRAAQLLYDGLVQFNEHDEVVPAIARRWEVSDDSLHYTFILRRDARFQDNRIFTNGIGRRILPSDFKFVFERLASSEVPSQGAGLFITNVRGFEPYYREQRELFYTEDRLLSEISGFKSLNDSTFVIELHSKDPKLLNKLASPVAAVYPREIMRDDSRQLKTSPVGSGKYRLLQSFGDTLHVFETNPNYYGFQNEEHEGIKRIEILINQNETELFRQMALGRLDMIPELGPQMVQAMLKNNGNLTDAYSDDYQLIVHTEAMNYGVYLNPENRFGITAAQAGNLLSAVSLESLRNNMNLTINNLTNNAGSTDATIPDAISRSFSKSDNANRLVMSFHQDVTARFLSAAIVQHFENDLSVAITPYRIRNRETVLHIKRQNDLVPESSISPLRDFVPLINIQLNRYLLHKSSVENILTNSSAWWIDFSKATVPSFNL